MKYVRLMVYIVAALFGAWLSLYPRLYGLAALGFLYLSLVPGGLYTVFPNLGGRVPFQKAKKALGISAFFLLLAYVWFTKSAFNVPSYGVREWVSRVSLLAALGILAILTITSIKSIKHRMRPWWKPLHRTVYLAGALLLVHTLTSMMRFMNVFSWLVVSYVLVECLLLVQLIRFDRFVRIQHPKLTHVIVGAAFPIVSLLFFWLFFFLEHSSF